MFILANKNSFYICVDELILIIDMIPKAFFITSGVGMAYDHDAAFDLALQDAGIGECNLVEVSSILPAKAKEVDKMSCRCTPGEITFCVLSRMAGKSGELIGAGVGYGWLRDSTDSNSPVFGIICEHHGHHSRDYLESKIRNKLKTMADSRNRNIDKDKDKELKLDLKRIEVKTAVVEEHKFGSVVAALVFVT